MGITIVGLGPGAGKYLTREAWSVLSEATAPIYLRTKHHPTISDLPAGLVWESFDKLYENSAEFPQVYAKIIAQLTELAATTDIIYAVPGNPYVGESTVTGIVALAKERNIDVRIVEGLSFVEPTLAAVGLDGLDGLQIYDAMTVAQYERAPINPDFPALLGQVYSQMLASELKLPLFGVYQPTFEVMLVHGAGGDNAIVERVPLHEIDRSPHMGNLTSLYIPARAEIGSLANFAETMAYLRSPNGCPWDREQTPQSMRPSFLEEMAEVIDALDRDDVDDLCDELGDLLLHIVFQAQLATEAGDFTLTDVIAGVDAKIKRRHPHVWGSVQADDADAVVQTWDQIKAEEKAERGSVPDSILDNVPLQLSALARTQKIQKRVAKVGFDWPDKSGAYAKFEEEIVEFAEAETLAHKSDELGDILYGVVNIARWEGIDAEIALREANLRFAERFRLVEQQMTKRGLEFAETDIELLEELWQNAKRLVASGKHTLD